MIGFLNQTKLKGEFNEEIISSYSVGRTWNIWNKLGNVRISIRGIMDIRLSVSTVIMNFNVWK